MVELCPVCLMPVEDEYPLYRARYKGKEYVFHTSRCKEKFLEDPEKYLAEGGPAGEEHCGVPEQK
ncbi:YHS domain-containing protein [Methanoculleus sp. Wushi-C6]|uniref:YHS domain-containing protein n=1 Tax=Methanoculleus caldifontis TaxID=2651577 RepID=A0ABU3X0U6_9EURY|nr:YHS domain-containing protein [Methanoculleus sp. Wushi-C6]MDV2481430.1 YHS domain-containing protein [Methanoculleus sp. Wushi-C6]